MISRICILLVFAVASLLYHGDSNTRIIKSVDIPQAHVQAVPAPTKIDPVKSFTYTGMDNLATFDIFVDGYKVDSGALCVDEYLYIPFIQFVAELNYKTSILYPSKHELIYNVLRDREQFDVYMKFQDGEIDVFNIGVNRSITDGGFIPNVCNGQIWYNDELYISPIYISYLCQLGVECDEETGTIRFTSK